MNYLWGHHRRFNAYSNYFKRTFGERVQKVTIDAGFTCPNRDGSKGTGGCAFCTNDAFNPSYCKPEKSITQQIDEGVEFHANRYRKAGKFLAYFQAYSNTYAKLEKLKEIYSEALAYPGIAGLVIGTRPDCVNDEILSYLKELSKEHYIIVEFGIESCYNDTLEYINRGHSFEEAVNAVKLTKEYGLKCGAHFIFGLPGESREMMMNSAKIISELPLDTVKFHQLQILKNTRFEKEYQETPEKFSFFQFEEYVDFIVDFLEQLNPAFVVERFAGEVPPRFQAGPGWGLIRNEQILARIEKRLEERQTWQGRHYK